MCLGIRCQYHKKVVCCDTAENVREVWACRADESTTRATSWVNSDWRTGRMVLFVFTRNKALSTVLQNLTK